MPQTSSRSHRGKSSRTGRSLKITIGVLLTLVVLIVLNAFALNNETEPAGLTVEGASLIDTTSGQIQVLDTGEPGQPAATDSLEPPLPLVLIHGTGGAINWWDDLIPLLSPGHRVIAVDMLGYGGSAKPDGGYSIESQASLIAQVLATSGVEQAVVVGHSLGSKVATSLAEQSPDLIAGLTVIDMAPDSGYGGLSGTANAAQLPLLGPALWRIAPDFMIRRNVAQAFIPDYEVPDKYVDDVREMTYPAYHSSFEESKKYTDATPLNERLEQVGLPLLVIFGSEDQLYPARESLSAYAAIPDTTTLLIPGVGHSPQVEAPDKTAAAINEFATSLLPPPPPPEPEPKPRPKAKTKSKAKKKQGDQSAGQSQQQKRKKTKKSPQSEPKATGQSSNG